MMVEFGTAIRKIKISKSATTAALRAKRLEVELIIFKANTGC